MKQCIEVEQLKVLNFEQQKIIATLFGQYGNCVRNDNEGNEYLNLGLLAERINIGRMFEIIDKSWFIELNPPEMDSQYNFELKIVERKDCKSKNDYIYEEEYYADELCDVLLDAITDQYLP